MSEVNHVVVCVFAFQRWCRRHLSKGIVSADVSGVSTVQGYASQTEYQDGGGFAQSTQSTGYGGDTIGYGVGQKREAPQSWQVRSSCDRRQRAPACLTILFRERSAEELVVKLDDITPCRHLLVLPSPAGHVHFFSIHFQRPLKVLCLEELKPMLVPQG